MSFSPLVRVITFAVIKSIKTQKLVEERKEVIDAELVPNVSKRVMEASFTMSEPKFIPLPKLEILEPSKEVVQPTLVKPTPVKQPRIIPIMQKPVQQRPKPMPRPIQNPPVAPPLISGPSSDGLTNDYGKIQPILLDKSVSTIECPGPGKQLSVIRAGQKEFTRIILTPEEIKEIIEKVGESAHIPVMEGVFRAAIDNFSINAVVSDMIGSKFTIKKQTPYSLLEGH